MKTSNLYALNYLDLLKGLLVAIISSVITVIQSSLDAGSLKFNWHIIGITALSSACAYILKNFFTPAQIVSKLNLSQKS